MIEIIAGVYLTCFALSWILIFWHFSFVSRELKSTKLVTLNHNLEKVGYFWSHSRGAIEKLGEFTAADDQKKSRRGVLWLGIFAFWSVPGFLILLAVILSLRFSFSSRKERAVLQSALAQNPELSPDEVLAQLPS
jgi:hypothetical protein